MSVTTLPHAAAAVKPQTVTAVNWRGNGSNWVVADPDASTGADLAHKWGHEDATEGNRRGGDMFLLLSAEYSSYHQGYNEGLRLRQRLTGDVSQGALDEAAWFDEIIPAAPLVAEKTPYKCRCGYSTTSDFMWFTHMQTCGSKAMDDAEEWIGQAFSTAPYNY